MKKQTKTVKKKASEKKAATAAQKPENSKHFIAACKKSDIDPSALPDLSMIPERFRDFVMANYKLAVMVEAENGGKTPNWNDSPTSKFRPWFSIKADEKRPEGFGFSFTHYACSDTRTTVGSRLLFDKSESALRAARNWKEYEDLILIKKKDKK